MNNFVVEENVQIKSINDLVYAIRGQNTIRKPTVSGRMEIKKIASDVKPKKKDIK